MKLRTIYTFALILTASIAADQFCQAQGASIKINDLSVLTNSKTTPQMVDNDLVMPTGSSTGSVGDLVILASADTTVTMLAANRTSSVPYGENLVALTGKDAVSSEVEIEELIVLTGDEATTDELFGPQMGNYHAFITIEGQYTDNVYNINVDEQENFTTSIAPGFWVIFPKAERVPLRLSSYNTAVGGSRFTLPGSGSFNRFQAYLLGGLDYRIHSKDSDLDYTAWTLEGLVQYNLPAGISFRIMDKFTSARDRIEIGSFVGSDFYLENQEIKVDKPSRLRDFISNQAVGFLNFDMSDKFSSMLTYANFYLDYDDPRDDWLDRIDNVFSLSLSYNHSPKTSFFVEGKYAVSDYDTADFNDNEKIFAYGGVSWNKSIKTQMLLKAGYQNKSFDQKIYNDIDRSDLSTFTTEAWLNYRYSEKTNMSFKLAKAIEETDTALSRGKDTISSRFFFNHDITERLRTKFVLRYEDYDYDGYYLGNVSRDEYIIGIEPSVQYDFRKWLMVELSYMFEERDSNIDLYDFTTQTVFLSINASF